ncbi:hypothetical protein [Rhodopseudomonas pseudopalustris]|nr:hypothetical protein [Rhodopseudomonas pseudopalustris]
MTKLIVAQTAGGNSKRAGRARRRQSLGLMLVRGLVLIETFLDKMVA